MTTRHVRIFASVTTPRLEYIAGLILGEILGLEWDIVTDRRRLGKYPVINYSGTEIKNSFRIIPHHLLFEEGISQKETTVTQWNNLPVFFQAPEGSDLPFDIFAASFYMVTRYEEYLGNDHDEHGRFRAASSLAYRNGFLLKPVVDLWTQEFARSLLKKNPTLAFRKNYFRGLLTIDTDQPFAYLGKNLLVSVGGLLRDVTTGRGNASERYKTVRHELRDPFDVFDFILDCIERCGTETYFFFPTGDHSRFDKNPSWKSQEYRDLIKRVISKNRFGLHPSYFSAEKLTVLEDEVSRLKTITGSEIKSSRYHYLRFFLPGSYTNLIRMGIEEDYSMGFADEPGFRAGIARPYYFYNLPGESQTSLRIVPFQVMDATLYQYLHLGPDASLEIILEIMENVRKAGGLFVSLWHNTTLLDDDEWKPWRRIFEIMLQNQKS